MKEEIWHFHSNFVNEEPKDLLIQLVKDDKANYIRAESELSETIDLLDRALALYIEALQGAYRMIDDWKSRTNFRAAMAMAGSALNYMLLARHSILLGYYPEARNLLRGCHECITRCYLFHADDEVAKRFFSGEPIRQKEVDEKLAQLLGDNDNKKAIYDSLRDSYRNYSAEAHPNIESMILRTLIPEGEDFKDSVGIHTVFGGVMASNFGETVILPAVSTMRFSLKVLGAVIVEGTGKWKDDLTRIEGEANKTFEKLKGQVSEQ